VVEYLSEVVAPLGGVNPFGNGSSCDGEECPEEERKEKRFGWRFEFSASCRAMC